MAPERRRELASLGGKAAPAESRGFSRDRELASSAGRKGGLARAAKGVGGRVPTWAGKRVEWVRGPYTGRTGVVIGAKSGNGLRVALDGSPGVILQPARTSVRVIDEVPA